jgi:glycosyltransferase involved in cell wall biosynthesis
MVMAEVIRTISVITPVFDGGHRHLGDAYESLAAQELPPGWTWEWHVQEDGSSGVPKNFLPSNDPRVSFGTGLAGGAGVARTMALTRASGAAVRSLDADDLLLPGALARDIDCLDRVAWCVSAGLDLLPDGKTVPGPYDPPTGPLPSDLFYSEQSVNRLSVLATNFAAHTDLIWALGGWTALTGAETIGLLLAAEAVTSGEFIAEPSMLYRKHSTQTTASERYWDQDESDTRLTFVMERAKSLRDLGWQWVPKSLDADEDPATLADVPSAGPPAGRPG